MKFYLVNLHFPDIYSDKIAMPPQGPGYVLAALDHHHLENRYYEFSFNPDVPALIADIQRFAPTLIGFSLRTHYYRESYKIIAEVARLNIPIVCGGAHINSHGPQILDDCPADFLLKGEGEQSLPLLLQNLNHPENYPAIPGLIYRRHGAIHENPPQLIDIDHVQFPTFRAFDLPAYSSATRMILSSRGCPYQCTFCQQLLGKKWRKRPPEDILREMEFWADRGHTTLNFADDNLTLDRPRIHALCRLIQKSKHRFRLATSGVRIDNVDPDTLKIMKDSGFHLLSFGIESGNDRVLKEIRKGITLAQIHHTLELSWKLGYEIKLYFIINNRTETYPEVQDTFKLAQAYPITQARFSNLEPFPGTYDYDWILRHGRLLYPPEEYLNNSPKYQDLPLYDGPGMSYDQRLQVIREARQLDFRLQHRTLAQRLHLNVDLLRHGHYKIVAGKFTRKTRQILHNLSLCREAT